MFYILERQIAQEVSVNPTQNYTSSIDLKINTSPSNSQMNPNIMGNSSGNQEISLFNNSHIQSFREENCKPTIKINGDVIFKKPINRESISKRLFKNNSYLSILFYVIYSIRKIVSAKNRESIRFSKRLNSIFSQSNEK